MLEAGALSGGERVLDIGSGPGHAALLFATRAGEVVASDPTAAMLDPGRRLAAERGLDNVRFELASTEQLRDSSHVRDHRVFEWREMFSEVGFDLEDRGAWDIPLEFEDWVRRSRTPEDDVATLRSCFAEASPQTRERFAVHGVGNWSVPIGLVVGTRG